jgi:hypothetical protein
MADITTQRNIGALVALVTSIPPENSSGGTINGNAIDRTLHGLANSCVLHQMVGAVSGAPTALAVQTALQHSPDGATWSPFQINGTAQQTAVLAAANSDNSAAIDLTTAYRFIRPEMTVTFTGGTTPSALVASDLVLGGERVLAAV